MKSVANILLFVTRVLASMLLSLALLGTQEAFFSSSSLLQDYEVLTFLLFIGTFNVF